MEGDISQMDVSEIKEKISELENTYADFLGEELDIHVMHCVWRRIQELREELRKRRSS
jgi:hypothetical protein